jgi:uncharacterized protein with LGFP repeats
MPARTRRRPGLLLQLGIVLALITGSLTIETATAPVTAPAAAANLSQFDPGNIISDRVFYDSATMSATQIQDFLIGKGGWIRNFRQNTTSRAADSYCRGYTGAANETAGAIIKKVADSCGINPRVLIVTLQKERSLITQTTYDARDYQIAMGYGCPDTALCDTKYYGFQNQLYSASSQFKRYAANPSRYGHRAGIVNNVRFHPNSACGSSAVHIVNQATASLYNYTPYQPNAAALAAGYGSGNTCSSYGNRNFWNWFTDWFGSTQSSGTAEILAAYKSLGSSTGTLGAPTTGYQCGLRDGGCFQHYQHGSIYWSPKSGAHSVTGQLRTRWSQLKWETGVLGYPTNEPYCGLVNGGCFQEFQGGSLYYQAAAGSHWTRDMVRAKWGSLQWENGKLGYPITDLACGLKNGGCFQRFQGGSVYYSSASGARYLDGPMQARWGALGWERGTLGYPTTDPMCGFTGAGCKQFFQGGNMYWTATTGARVSRGTIRDRWAALNGEKGVLGWPTSDVICGIVDSGCFQKFQGGSVYDSASTAAQSVRGELYKGWARLRWETGVLGYPTGEETCGLVNGGCGQSFQGGSLYWSTATGAHFVRKTIRLAWRKAGAEAGALGYPRTDEMCGIAGGGCFQKFQGGSIYWTATTGAHPVTGLIYDKWASLSWEYGRLGYPTTDAVAVPGGFQQRFQKGTLTSNTTTNQVTIS